jgi:hypothetical protein
LCRLGCKPKIKLDGQCLLQKNTEREVEGRYWYGDGRTWVMGSGGRAWGCDFVPSPLVLISVISWIAFEAAKEPIHDVTPINTNRTTAIRNFHTISSQSLLFHFLESSFS